MCSQNTRRP